MDPDEAAPPIHCARCVTELIPGRGEFYVVEIEAKADPTPPILDPSDLKRDYKSEINALVAELEHLAPQNQRVTIHLCMSCYPAWIEKPAS
ncbi:MAG: hypothetical protein H6821_07380 [Planctomycetaceae bacterium]|nr:hypothetical protein [Planctomycetales bacterium]MCB9873986.1 hypothetical protein [Planctomycetaceae bacterium]MCB9938551.1 hypothetical protein [Planctomycetaceae bacterium]